MADAAPSQSERSLRIDILPLAVAQLVIWASMYYSFPALLPDWERDLGWSKTQLSGAFTGALLITALLAPIAGRMIDRGAARLIHPGGALIGGLLLIALSQVTQVWQFYAVWLAMGVMMAVSLYEACFAIITVTTGNRARTAITAVTLIGGFAGTIAFPAAHVLAENFGWRGALICFGLAIILLVIPLMLWGLRRLERHRIEPEEVTAEAAAPVHAAVTRRPAFWCLALAFGAIGLTHGLILGHLLPILADRGIGEAAAVLAASMIGPMQVVGRAVTMATEKYVNIFGVAIGCYTGMALGSTALLMAGVAPWLVVVFVLLHGAGYGTASILRPVLTAELLGRRGFGATAGKLALPFMCGFAAGPTIAALVWEAAGYDGVLMLALGVICIGLGAVFMAARTA
ncbi:MAG: MFS transporter [Paracoccaceae bacterium]|nr:MFS transporter [Paracoccaceae bacterium]